MASGAAVGVDVGGTKILAGVVSPDGTIHQTMRLPTPRDADDLVTAIVDVVGDLGPGTDGLPVGCGFPALVTREGVTRYGPNITLAEYPLRDVLAARLGTTVVLDNDASAAAWAEFTVGAGRGVRDTMIMFTLGTGVGGGLIVSGRLHRGANGFAGELGHVVIDIDGAVGASGIAGEVEAYSSGTAIGRLAGEAHAAGRFAGTVLDGPAPPDGTVLTAAALDGVAPAIGVLAIAGRHLGVAAAGLANALDPELVVVGGGAARGGELILGPARAALHEHLLGAQHRPPIPLVAAELGPDAGMIGAALLAMDAGGGS